MPRSESGGRSSQALLLASIAIVVAALYFARDFLVPIALAILLSFMLAPLVRQVERTGVGRVLSVIIVVLLSFGVIGVIGWAVTGQLIDLSQKLPQYSGNIRAKIERVRASGSLLEKPATMLKEISQELAGPTSRPAAAGVQPPGGAAPAQAQTPPVPTATQPVRVQVVEPAPSAVRFLRENITPLLSPLTTAGIVVVFVIFVLLQREDLRDRIIRLVSRGRLNLTTRAMDDAGGRISRYLLMQLLVNTGYAVPITIGLYFIGVPNALLWGLLAALLRFIPYLGAWIAAGLPILLSLAAFNDFRHVLLTIALYIAVELVTINFVEPYLYGSSTGLSPSAVLVAAAFWTWIWGPIGLLLSTPLTACLVVIGKYAPQLQFLDILLGDQPVLSPAVRVYQRLLAQDPEEATDLVEEYSKDKPLAELYDAVLVPALIMAEEDLEAGQLSEQRHRFVLESIGEMVQDIGERLGFSNLELQRPRSEGAATTPVGNGDPASCALCLPAHDEADELAAMMLAQLLRQSGSEARYAATGVLAGEMAEIVSSGKWRIVCISALPPGAMAHTRYIFKRLRARVPDLRLIAGLWGSKSDPEKARQRIGCAAGDQVFRSLAEAAGHVQPLAVSLAAQKDAGVEAASIP